MDAGDGDDSCYDNCGDISLPRLLPIPLTALIKQDDSTCPAMSLCSFAQLPPGL